MIFAAHEKNGEFLSVIFKKNYRLFIYVYSVLFDFLDPSGLSTHILRYFLSF